MLIVNELVKRGVISESQASEIVDVANTKYGGDIDQSLLYFNVDEDVILDIKGKLFNIPTKIVDPLEILPSVLKIVPYETASNYSFVPIGISDGALEIGILNPDNVQSTDVLTFIAAKMNNPYKLFIIKTSTFNEILKRYDGLSNEVDQALSELDKEIAETSSDKKDEKKDEKENKNKSETIVEDAPIIKIVATIIRHASERGASDIHIENVGDKVKVRFRVDGILHTSIVLPINVYNAVIARIKILAKLRLDEKRKPQDGGFSAKIDGRKIDFRVSTMPSYYGEKVVMRILDSQKGVKPLESLYLSDEYLSLMREALGKPYGLILITGPTGSGKTTTLYSMLNELDREQSNVVSLEDPVEYQIPGINQSQVAPEIGYTFASGLRSILRQDPDIIMVGEIRDKETAELAIQAALTGHLVFSTLHTNNAIGAIPRLIDMGIDPYLIAPTLILCIAQRLARKIALGAEKPMEMSDAIKIMIDKQFEDLPVDIKSKIKMRDQIYDVVSTPEAPSGMQGRVPVFEMFKVDKEMQNVILKSPSEQDIYKLARSKGMVTLKEDAIIKSMKGLVPFKEVYNL
jgi:type IV pilus assembly protein PilB